jgi:ribonuclease BN (tRNA processing enzyme)
LLRGKVVPGQCGGERFFLAFKRFFGRSGAKAFRAGMMKLIFLGTRGNTAKRRMREHRWHSALMIEHGGSRVMIDCGEDWLDRLTGLAPDAVVVTHAHPDHAWGLKEGAPCPVYATKAAWRDMAVYPIETRQVVVPRIPWRLDGLSLEAFPVEHSILCPAVGYRIDAECAAFFYVPDVVVIEERAAALTGAALFIGDGATLTRLMVRRRDGKLFGHTPIRTQLGWCQKEGVRRAIFTHCGSEIVGADGRKLAARLRALGRARHVEARIARDGMVIELP